MNGYALTKNRNKEKAVCIVSGGLDSICTAAYIKKQNYELYLISFLYGQKSLQEIKKAKEFAKIFGVKDHKIIDISFMKHLYGKTNVLTFDNKKRLPTSFQYDIVVPIRNAIFITIAAAWAMSIGAKLVGYGAHSGDKNYPDCRPEFVRSITDTLNMAEIDGIKLGVREKIQVWSPAIDGLDKSDLLKKGYEILGNLIFKTWSCYSNGAKKASGNSKEKIKIQFLHCGKCESCINRRNAFNIARIEDKTRYAR
ncbi:MAG: 7-cyano-7-deazaguanine synthase [Nitrososphaeraceae archaeon]|nr:7-cyano-7-deazaguanine synthase [Nitrososphaeraceae archaeon]